jgi:two-component sensor histidine kinase
VADRDSKLRNPARRAKHDQPAEPSAIVGIETPTRIPPEFPPDAELSLTRKRLQATIEKLESTNEELKSSNEEYKSINEELQSCNEELETSKEELQTVNAALRESEARLRVLLAEIQHRVRNTLALVKSIAARTAQSSSSIDEMAAHFAGRLDAFARVQAAVTRNPEAGIDLAGMVTEELLVHAAQEGEQLTIQGPDVALRPKAAESVSLALHELATNAVKHGALMSKNGRIDIGWWLNGKGGDAEVEFKWAESGVYGSVAKPRRKGFGIELLTRVLPYDLGATTRLDFAPDGISFTMQLPVEHLIELDGAAA